MFHIYMKRWQGFNPCFALIVRRMVQPPAWYLNLSLYGVGCCLITFVHRSRWFSCNTKCLFVCGFPCLLPAPHLSFHVGVAYVVNLAGVPVRVLCFCSACVPIRVLCPPFTPPSLQENYPVIGSEHNIMHTRSSK